MRKILQLTLAFVLAAAGGLWAQGVTNSTLTGKVTDQKGEPLPGANIVATHTASGTTYGSTSLPDGRFTIPGLRSGGPYTIKVSFVGFKENVKENMFLELGETLVFNSKMVDDATQLSEVVVSGVQDPILNSDKIGASSNFSTNQISRLPSIGRDFRDISRLTPQAGGSSFTFGGRSNLFNNLTIDGATANNVFGLDPLPGGQSLATPFSIDAIQEITVSLSPYDLRQGNFTGAGISAITRSGTNDFQGSAYYFFRTQNLAGKKVDGQEIPLTNFDFKNYGFRLGGPIIKNKLFFFANFELENRIDPAYTNPVRADKTQSVTGATQATDDNDPETGLKGLQDFLLTKLNYDPGVYKDFNLTTNNKRYVVRFDYNINSRHKLTVRGNVTNAYRDREPSTSGSFTQSPTGGRGNSNNVNSFSSSYYRQINNQYSVTAELNSTFGEGKMSNNLVAGYSAFRDFRQNAGGLPVPSIPTVDIFGPSGQNLTSFGPDPFTPNNKLYYDVIQLNDFFNIYKKNNTITFGTANELYTFTNRFTQVVNSIYRYNSLAEFYADADTDPAVNSTARPALYGIQTITVPGGADATAPKWSALQLGAFAQDEYTGIKNLKLTAGIRVDIPTYLTDLTSANYYNSIDFNGEQVRSGGWPKVTPLWSPRVGFNWDVKGDRSLQVRGGSGVLTGRVPFVWIQNAVGNNGLFFGQINNLGSVPFSNTGDGVPYDFSLTPYTAPEKTFANLETGTPSLVTNPLDRNYGRPAVVTAINTVTKNFKFPQVWRTNIAVDKQLPYGIVGTFEFIFTKDINAPLLRDANLAPSTATLAGDGRPLYGASGADRTIIANDRRVNGDVGQVIVLDNTKKGYQYSATLQLQKNFNRNFQVSAAYTYTDAREVNSGSFSTAGTYLNGNQNANVLGINNVGTSYSGTLTPHRVIAYGTYRKEYLDHFATTFGLTFEGRSGSLFSYQYGGDVNSDGSNNDLMYVPKSKEEIVLTPSNASDTRTTGQIWNDLDTYISQDKYLSERRGKYAERNGAISPWVNRLNLSLLQDFYMDVKGKRNTIQLSINLENALNLFSSSAGLTKFAARPQLLRFVGYEQPNTAGSLATPVYGTAGIPSNLAGTPFAPTTGKPVFAFDNNADGTPLNESFINSTAVGARWQLQFGVRYIF
jgi:hypothetical protein